MCGFAGFVGLKEPKLISRMTQVLGHRGPDDEGIFTSKKASFGHRRLAIIDLSKKGHQPMFNEDRSVVLIYNGEVYNFQGLKKQLIEKGHKFRSKTDSEVILHSFEEWGIRAVKKFQGCFAFALWDKKRETLFLVRDRIGIKPVYYYQNGSQLFFASEIKAILENKKIKRAINEPAYFQYLAFQASLSDQTLFQGIKKVPPATILTFKNNKLSFKKYWQLKKDSKIQVLNQEKLQQKLKQLLKEVVKIRLISDVPLGVLLSGGLDSSSLVALMSQVTRQPINTFSVGFGQKDDELKYARIVAEKFKTCHQEIIIKPKNLQRVLRKIVWHQDEPLADGGGVATYLAAQEVSKKVKVVLSGEGGDEAFGGYSWYKLGVLPFTFLPHSLKQKIYFYLTTFYRKEKCQNKGQFQNFQKIFNREEDNFLNKMIKFEIENILPNSLCMKLDKMTSSWGLEARTPFLDHKLLEFCFSLPKKYKVSLFKNKLLFRETMADLLPLEILARKKHGFLLPTEKWLRSGLKKFAQEVILDKKSHARGLYLRKELEDLFRPQRGFAEIERINLLWRLFIFELWYEAFSASS